MKKALFLSYIIGMILITLPLFTALISLDLTLTSYVLTATVWFTLPTYSIIYGFCLSSFFKKAWWFPIVMTAIFIGIFYMAYNLDLLMLLFNLLYLALGIICMGIGSFFKKRIVDRRLTTKE